MLNRRHFLSVTAVGAGVLFLSGCSKPPVNDKLEFSRAEVEAAFGEVSNALGEGNWPELASHLEDKDSQSWKRVLAVRKQLPQSRWEVGLGNKGWATTFASGESLTLVGELRHQIMGADPDYFSQPILLTLNRRGGSAHVTNMEFEPGFDMPWNFADVSVLESEGLVIMCTHEIASQIRPRIAEFEEAVAVIKAETTPFNPRDKVVVWWGKLGDEHSRKMFGKLWNRENSVGATTMHMTSNPSTYIPRVRIFASPDELGDIAGKSQATRMLAHELVHAHTFVTATEYQRPWISEGLAVWGSRDLILQPEALSRLVQVQDISFAAANAFSWSYSQGTTTLDYYCGGAFYLWLESKCGRSRVWEMGKIAMRQNDLDAAFAIPLGAKRMGDLMPEWKEWMLAQR